MHENFFHFDGFNFSSLPCRAPSVREASSVVVIVIVVVVVIIGDFLICVF